MAAPADNDWTTLLANLQTLLYLRRRGARGFLYDNDFVWTAWKTRPCRCAKPWNGGCSSVFCLGDRAGGVEETGVQYPLRDAVLTAGSPAG